MDIHSWRSGVPTPTKVFNLADSSDSDGELPSLPITAAAARKNINDVPGPSQSASSSSAAAAPGTAPVLVPPRAAPVNSMFIGSKQREHPLPANARKTVPSHQSPTTFFTANQYRQPREAVVIDDSPPPKQHNSLKDALPQSPSHSKRFLSPARQPLTEISSSSSTDSVVLVNTVAPKASTSSSSWNHHVRKPSYEPYSDNKPTSTPRKTVGDGYSSHVPAKARIIASFNLPKQQHHLAPATPIGKPRDPTMYSSHSAYKPSTSTDADLSGDLNPALIEQINRRVAERRSDFERAIQEENTHHEGALESLCAEIYTDMTQVEKGEEQIDGLACKLLPHQVTGIAWLVSRETGKKKGGILADDMGLGKTVQSLALIVKNRPKEKPKTTLIVAPVALLHQWENEIRNKTTCEPALKILQHHGSNRTKDARKLMKYDIVLTTYETLRNDLPKKAKKSKKSSKFQSSAFSQQKLAFGSSLQTQDASDGEEEDDDGPPGPLIEASFHRVILDEAHLIKNRSTNAAKACFALQSKYRWCLTGTPIQNGVGDIFSLFHFLGKSVQPLNDYSQFKDRIEVPLGRGKTELAMKRLHYVLASVMLRRTKNMLIDGKPLITLPPRTVNLIQTEFLDPEEREYYNAVQARVQLEFNKYLKRGALNSEYIAILTLLLRLRQICNHPDLANKGDDREDRETKAISSGNSKAQSKVSDDDLDDLIGAMAGVGLQAKTCGLCQEAFQPLHNSSDERDSKYCVKCRDVFKSYAEENASTKIIKILEVLKRMIQEDGDEKALIFSQFTSFFDILRPFLRRANIKFVVYQGSMNKQKREESLTAIREDPSVKVILVSLKAGAQGLNLTCCSRVIISDLWWNPAIENQAIDRAHRMGQKKPVHVYKFVINGTVEEKINTLQEEKKALADAAIDGGNVKKLNKLSTKDLMYLFNVDDPHARPHDRR